MIIRIFSTQFDFKTVFKISHELDLLIEKTINNFLKDKLKSKYPDLIYFDIDISSKSDIASDFSIGNLIKRTKEKSYYQFIYLNSKYLNYKDDFELHSKKFDFILKVNAYRTFSTDIYVNLVIDAISESINIPEISSLKDQINKVISTNGSFYKYKNEEILYLEYLLSNKGKIWLSSEESKLFRQSIAYTKWIVLLNKYQLTNEGNVKF